MIRSLGISLVAVGAVLMFASSEAVPEPILPRLEVVVASAAVATISCAALGYLKEVDRAMVVVALGLAAVLATSGGDGIWAFVLGGAVLAIGLGLVALAAPSIAALLGAASLTIPPAMTVAPYWAAAIGIALATTSFLESISGRSRLVAGQSMDGSSTADDASVDACELDAVGPTERAEIEPIEVDETAHPSPEDDEPDSIETTIDALATDMAYVVVGSERGRPRWSRSQDHGPPKRFAMPREGHCYDGYGIEGFVVRCASHVGYRHMVDVSEREDSYAVVLSADRRCLHAIVADGVGSASHAGATAVVASDLIARRLDAGESIDDTLALLGEDLSGTLSNRYPDVDPHDFATTIIVATVDMRSSSVSVRRIGDSTAFVLRNGQLVCLFDDDGLPETHAVPALVPKVELATLEIEVDEALLVCTDGVADQLLFSSAVKSVFEEQLVTAPSALDFCRLVGFEARQGHDDQTAVAIWKRS